jgi:hypothetical protein
VRKKTHVLLGRNLTLMKSVTGTFLPYRECSGSPKRRIHRNVQQESKSEYVKRKCIIFSCTQYVACLAHTVALSK